EMLARRTQLREIGGAGFRAQFHQCAAGEIDAEIHAHREKQGDGNDGEKGGKGIAHAPEAHEAEFRVLRSETQELHLRGLSKLKSAAAPAARSDTKPRSSCASSSPP